MSNARNLADLLDSTGDIKSDALDNVPAADVVNDTTPQLGGDLDTNGSNINFSDNVKAQFGASNDLQIYHTGSYSTIHDSGTGNLSIKATDLVLGDSGGNAFVVCTDNGTGGEVALYHNAVEKLTTTSTGVSVTGEVISSTGKFGLDSTDFLQWSNGQSLNFTINNVDAARMEADGDFHADGDVIAYSTTISDERLKENIQPIDDALAKIKQLNGCTFTYTADGKKSAGLIAQDVEKVLPSAVSEKELPLKQDDGIAYKTLQYDQTIGLLVEAIKELTAKVEELENR